MEIQSNKEAQNLPQLIKQPTTYKLNIPKKVEEKIRYLIRKFPHTEWSGVLFYTHTGSFENNTLALTCEDIFPMDLGTSGWTEFKMTPDVSAYIAQNMELFDCEMGLVHSHHTLGAFFSGQDIKTLQLEGKDTNCFVSLIVDTRGTYQAAVTRKMQKKTEVVTKSLGTSYEFFGDGPIVTEEDPMSEVTQVIDREVIEYFMLDIHKEEVDNPLSYLDARFDEIESQKKKGITVETPWQSTEKIPAPKWDKDGSLVKSLPSDLHDNDDFSFRDWLNYKGEKETKTIKEPTLFSEEVMDELVDTSKWEPDPEIIHHLVCQLVTCSLIINKDIDLKQWVVRHMENKYNEIFGAVNEEFSSWVDCYVEFILSHYNDPHIPEDIYLDWDLLQSKIATAIADELGEYPSNNYLEAYNEALTRYIYE